MTRYELINELIRRHDYRSYLEIGVSTGDCYRHVECDVKHWIDPYPKCSLPGGIYMSSDDALSCMSDTFDLIFIDGDHRWQQVLRDISNSVDHLTPMGTIVVHDCNPQTEQAQLESPTTGPWNGSVWRAFVQARYDLRDTHVMLTVDTDEGLGIVRAAKPWGLFANPVYNKYKAEDLTWRILTENRSELLRLMSVQQFLAWDSSIAACAKREQNQA